MTPLLVLVLTALRRHAQLLFLEIERQSRKHAVVRETGYGIQLEIVLYLGIDEQFQCKICHFIFTSPAM